MAIRRNTPKSLSYKRRALQRNRCRAFTYDSRNGRLWTGDPLNPISVNSSSSPLKRPLAGVRIPKKKRSNPRRGRMEITPRMKQVLAARGSFSIIPLDIHR